MAHHAGLTGAATGTDGTGPRSARWPGPENQDPGEAQRGAWKFGPTVHALNSSATVAPKPKIGLRINVPSISAR